MFQNVKGTTDFYPEEEYSKLKVFNSLSSTAKKFGFQNITVPAVENFKLLSKKQGEEIREQIFTIEKKGKEDLAMRAEFTPSFARMFIQKQKQLPKPVKWFSIGKVWRYEKPQKGREREFYQYNVEMYGSKEPIADAEIISLAIESLKNLGLKENDFEVRVNNRKLMQGILEKYSKKPEELMRIIDKRNKVSKTDFIDMLKQKSAEKIVEYLDLNDINKVKTDNKLAEEGLNELKEVLKLLNYKCVKFSPETARGLSYYTGTVFEIFDSKGKFRSLCGGGRYDNMIELFNGESTPALGFGMGWSTLSLLLKEKNLLPEPNLGPDYFIATLGNEKEALKLAKKLRKNNSVVVNLQDKNLGNQFKYADKINAKNVIVVGEEEIRSKKFKVKNMKTGKETTLPYTDLKKI